MMDEDGHPWLWFGLVWCACFGLVTLVEVRGCGTGVILVCG